MDDSEELKWCSTSQIEEFLETVRKTSLKCNDPERIPYISLSHNFSGKLVNMGVRLKYHKKKSKNLKEYHKRIQTDKELKQSILYINQRTKRLAKKMKKDYDILKKNYETRQNKLINKKVQEAKTNGEKIDLEKIKNEIDETTNCCDQYIIIPICFNLRYICDIQDENFTLFEQNKISKANHFSFLLIDMQFRNICFFDSMAMKIVADFFKDVVSTWILNPYTQKHFKFLINPKQENYDLEFLYFNQGHQLDSSSCGYYVCLYSYLFFSSNETPYWFNFNKNHQEECDDNCVHEMCNDKFIKTKFIKKFNEFIKDK